jgi:hypothetical protein
MEQKDEKGSDGERKKERKNFKVCGSIFITKMTRL